MKKKTIALFLLVVNPTIYAQKRVTNQVLVWYGYYNSLTFNEDWKLNTEIQERHFIKPFAQHQFVLRGNLERKLFKNLSASIGMTFFFQSPHDPNDESDLIVPELRPNVGFLSNQQFGVLKITHRYRGEARFFHQVENNELDGGFVFSHFRFRYQLGLEIPIMKSNAVDKILLKLKDEIMINAGNKVATNSFDQNRIYLGVNYIINSKFSVEAGYMNWFQQQKSGVDYYNRNILRFSLFHSITLKNNKND